MTQGVFSQDAGDGFCQCGHARVVVFALASEQFQRVARDVDAVADGVALVGGVGRAAGSAST